MSSFASSFFTRLKMPKNRAFPYTTPGNCDNFLPFPRRRHVMKIANPRFALAVCMFIGILSLSAQASYTTANVKGSYSFLLDEWIASTNGNSAVVGVLTFDGVSAVTGSFTYVTGTGLDSGTFEAGSTYTVKPTGSGTINLLTAGGTITLDFVLTSVAGGVAQGLQILEIEAANLITAGSAIAMNLSGSASAANLKGIYSFLTNYWSADPTQTQQANVGTASFDGVSKVTLTDVQEQGGVEKNVTLLGTYSVNANGTGTMNFTVKGVPLPIDFAMNTITGSLAKGFQFLTGDSTTDKVGTGTGVFQ
jgi:hypothetical protein